MSDLVSKSRFEDHTVWAFVTGETFDPLVERVRRMLSHERRVVLMRRYIGKSEAERGTYDMDVKVGLRLDPRVDEPIELTSSKFPEQIRDLRVRLTGSESFGFGAPMSLTERVASRRYQNRETERDHVTTHVTITGRGIEPNRGDRIDIERWNEHCVGQLTTIVFQADWDG